MCYFMHDGDGQPLAHPEQIRMANYHEPFPGDAMEEEALANMDVEEEDAPMHALIRETERMALDRHPEIMPIPLPAATPLRTQTPRSVREEDDDEELELLSDDAVLDNMEEGSSQKRPRRLSGESAAAALPPPPRPPDQRYAYRLTHLLRNVRPDTVAVKFPFAGITFEINNHFCAPETLALLDLPFPICSRLPAVTFQVGLIPVDPDEMKGLVVATEFINKLERAAVARPATISGDVPSTTTNATASVIPASSLPSRVDFEARKSVITKETMRAIKDEEYRVIDEAIMREGMSIRSGRHYTLLVYNPEFDHNASYAFVPGSEFSSVGYRKLLDANASIINRVRNVTRQSILRDRLVQQQQQQKQRDQLAEDHVITHLANNLDETDALLQQQQQQQAFSAKDEAMADEIASRIAANFVDTLDPVFVAADDILAARIDYQTKKGGIVIAADEEMKALRARMAEATSDYARRNIERERDEVIKELRDQMWRLNVGTAEQCLDLLRTSNNIASTLMSDDLRQFESKVMSEEGMRGLYCHHPDLRYNHKPFVQCINDLVTVVVACMKIYGSNIGLFLTMFFSKIDAHRWEPNRLLPALNLLILGPTGVGKSFLQRVAVALSAPGSYQQFTNVTAQVFNTQANFDNLIMFFEEMKNGWLVLNHEQKQAGSSDELNFTKDRLTRFYTSILSFHRDPQTGRRVPVSAKASCHNVTISASNLEASKIETTMARRFMMLYLAKLKGDAAGSMADDYNIKEFTDSEMSRVPLQRMRTVDLMIIVLRSFIKTGCLQEVSASAAQIYLAAIVKELEGRKIHVSKEVIHFILNMAANIQLFFAAWMTLFSKEAHEYHKRPDSAPRWSAESIMLLAGRYMVTSIDALVLALCLLEALYAPRHEFQTMLDLASKILRLGDEHHTPQYVVNKNARSELECDPNYFEIKGKNDEGIFSYISKSNDHYEMRWSDVKKKFDDLCQEYMTVDERAVDEIDAKTGQPRGPIRRTGRQVQKLKAMIEDSPTQNRQRRLCILVQYVEEVLGIDVAKPTETRTKLEAKREIVNSIDMDFSRGLMNIIYFKEGDTNSPVIDALFKAVQHPMLGQLPKTNMSGLDARVHEYITPFVPVHVNVKYGQKLKDVVSLDGNMREEDKLGFAGVMKLIRLMPNAKKRILAKENRDFLPPSAELNLKRFQSDMSTVSRADVYSKAQLILFDESDPEFTFGVEYLQSIFHPGLKMTNELVKNHLPHLRPHLPHLPVNMNRVNYEIQQKLYETKTPDAMTKWINWPLADLESKVTRMVNAERYRCTGKSESAVSVSKLTSGCHVYAGFNFSLDKDATTTPANGHRHRSEESGV
jgi:flagellar biosynthesis GTPase FlhF